MLGNRNSPIHYSSEVCKTLNSSAVVSSIPGPDSCPRFNIFRGKITLKVRTKNILNDLIKRLKKRDTLGSVKFDSVVISDFDESLKSVTTSLLYTDITPKEKYFITLNQWFDESLLKETSSQPLYFPSANKDNYDEVVLAQQAFKIEIDNIKAKINIEINKTYVTYLNNFLIDILLINNKIIPIINKLITCP